MRRSEIIRILTAICSRGEQVNRSGPNSLRALNTVESFKEWAEKNGLINHPLVVEKLEELRTDRLEIRKEESQRATQLYAIPTQDSEDEFAVQPEPVVRSSSLQCPDCPKSIKRKNELKVHIKARHEKVAFLVANVKKHLLTRQMRNDTRQSVTGVQNSKLSSEQKSVNN